MRRARMNWGRNGSRRRTCRRPAPAAPAAAPAQGYVQKTQFDNSPWRFDMNQNGRRMTAEEFDAWMKAKGIRVATGKGLKEAKDCWDVGKMKMVSVDCTDARAASLLMAELRNSNCEVL